MVAALRLARVAGRVAMPRIPAFRATGASITQRAAFSASARTFKSGVVKETEVPVSVYSPDSKGTASGAAAADHFTISVKEGAQAPPEAIDEIDDSVNPISEKVYKALPRTLQKMTCYGKVVIITG